MGTYSNNKVEKRKKENKKKELIHPLTLSPRARVTKKIACTAV